MQPHYIEVLLTGCIEPSWWYRGYIGEICTLDTSKVDGVGKLAGHPIVNGGGGWIAFCDYIDLNNANNEQLLILLQEY
jgi:hypothetical protein